MSTYDEYADALARADEGLPARPGDAALIAAGDERLGWADAEHVARRHDESIEEMGAVTNAPLYAGTADWLVDADARPPADGLSRGHCQSCGVALTPGGSVDNRPEEPAEHFAGCGEIVYVVMSPRRFVTELTIYAGPAGRVEELRQLAGSDCPRTGHVYDLDGRTAASILWARPHQAYGWQDGDDWYEPSEQEMDTHYGHREPVPSCPVCRPIRRPWRDRLVARCVAAMDERAATRRGPGRPPVGEPINTRLTVEQLTEVDARAREAGVSRAEMIRRLVEAGMRVVVVAEIDGLRNGETLVIERRQELDYNN